ncbi:MAG: hypothetical protein AB7S61_09155 [Methanoregulaceae archaeon]
MGRPDRIFMKSIMRITGAGGGEAERDQEVFNGHLQRGCAFSDPTETDKDHYRKTSKGRGSALDLEERDQNDHS